MFTDADTAAVPAPPPAPDPTGSAVPDTMPPATAGPDEPTHAPLPLVALVLGIAGVALGLTVIWFFAAIPVGIVSIGIGLVARRRARTSADPRALSRATIGIALGCVALLLGVSGAYFLPRVIDRWDRFLGSVQQDVNDDVGLVNSGLSRDVSRLDRTLSRDLRRFEAQNRADLRDLERRSAATLAALEARINADVTSGTAAARRDLAQLETRLTEDLEELEAALRASDNALYSTIGRLDARINSIEEQIGG
jgi:hypothetical protein